MSCSILMLWVAGVSLEELSPLPTAQAVRSGGRCVRMGIAVCGPSLPCLVGLVRNCPHRNPYRDLSVAGFKGATWLDPLAGVR